MGDQAKYQANFTGQFFGNQISVGEHNTLEQHATFAAAQRLDPAELASLMEEFSALRDLVATRLSGDQQQAALTQVGELEAATLAAEEPEPRRLARLYRWFVDNAPALAESVATLLLGPLVGKLVGGGAGAMAATLAPEERQLDKGRP